MSLSPSDSRALVDTELVALLKLRNRNIAWINPGAESLSGWSLADVIGQSIRLFHVDDAAFEQFFAAAEAPLRAGRTHRCQLRMRRRDGGMVEVDAKLIAPPGPEGDLLCVLHDITELRRAEDIRLRAAALGTENRQLVEAARVKRVFLTNMSHELYTPLNAIIGYAHLLGTGAIPADSLRFAKYLADIGSSGQQLLAQIQHALACTEVESGHFDLQPRRAELRAVLEGAIEVAQDACRAKGVGVTFAMAPESLELTIDPIRLSQVVSQCLSNAIRFSHAGGQVELRAQALDERSFRVEVQDHGVGIAPERLPHLFTALRQPGEGPARKQAGLGLALTRRLVEAMDGTIAVASTPGVGSVFTVTLPRSAA